MSDRTTALATLTLAILAACASGPAPSSDATETADYVLVLLKTGPKQDVAPGELQELMASHFANMERLANTGELILAGPFAPPRTDPELRGVLVFDTDDLDRAEQLTESDPTVSAGIFRHEQFPWTGPAAMRRVPDLERQARETMSPDAGPEATIVPFVIVTCAEADRVERGLRPLDDNGKVGFFGRLGGPDSDDALFALVARDIEEARAMLSDTFDEAAPAWTLHPWYGSRALLEM